MQNKRRQGGGKPPLFFWEKPERDLSLLINSEVFYEHYSGGRFSLAFPKVLCIILSKQKTYFRQGRLAWN